MIQLRGNKKTDKKDKAEYHRLIRHIYDISEIIKFLQNGSDLKSILETKDYYLWRHRKIQLNEFKIFKDIEQKKKELKQFLHDEVTCSTHKFIEKI